VEAQVEAPEGRPVPERLRPLDHRHAAADRGGGCERVAELVDERQERDADEEAERQDGELESHSPTVAPKPV
jgi:hypothetical protein